MRGLGNSGICGNRCAECRVGLEKHDHIHCRPVQAGGNSSVKLRLDRSGDEVVQAVVGSGDDGLEKAVEVGWADPQVPLGTKPDSGQLAAGDVGADLAFADAQIASDLGDGEEARRDGRFCWCCRVHGQVQCSSMDHTAVRWVSVFNLMCE